jgi:hypothetical protein
VLVGIPSANNTNRAESQIENIKNRIVTKYYDHKIGRCSIDPDVLILAATIAHTCTLSIESYALHMKYAPRDKSFWQLVREKMGVQWIVKDCYDCIQYRKRKGKMRSFLPVYDLSTTGRTRHQAAKAGSPLLRTFPLFRYLAGAGALTTALLCWIFLIAPVMAHDEIIKPNSWDSTFASITYMICGMFLIWRFVVPMIKLRKPVPPWNGYDAYQSQYKSDFRLTSNGHAWARNPKNEPMKWAGMTLQYQDLKPPREGAEFSVKPGRYIDYTQEAPDSLYHYGIGFVQAVPMVAAKTHTNMAASILHRQVREVAVPDSAAVRSFEAFCGFEGSTGRMDYHIEPDFETWNNRFPEIKKMRHREALKRVTNPDVLEPRHLVFDTFQKIELIGKQGEKFDPRNINGCSSEYSVHLGPFIQAINEKMKKQWSVDEPIYYTSGATVDQLGLWFDKWTAKFGAPYYLENDFSRFDSTIAPELLKVEFDFYRRFGTTPVIEQCLEAQIHTVGSTREGFLYKVKGTRKSGTPNTSFGNSYLNLMAHMWIMSELDMFPGRDYAIMAVGDDMLMIVNPIIDRTELLSRITKGCKSLGFEPKAKINTEIHQVEYCSKLFWPSNKGTIAGPKVGRFLLRAGWSVKPLQTKDKEVETIAKRLKGIGMTMFPMSSHIPIVGSISASYASIHTKGKLFDTEIYDRIDTSEACPEATEATYDFFSKRYGIDHYTWLREFRYAVDEISAEMTKPDGQPGVLIPTTTDKPVPAMCLLDLDISWAMRDITGETDPSFH